mgnify:CR=1 FL=1
MIGNKVPGRTKDTLKAAKLQVHAAVAPSDGIVELGLLVNGLVLVGYIGLMWVQADKWQPTGFGILTLGAVVQCAIGLILLARGFLTKKRKWLTYGPGLLLNLGALAAIGFFIATGTAG